MIPIRKICLTLLLIAMPAWAASPDIDRVVHGFYSAYASGNVVAAASFWTSDGAQAFATRNARTLRLRCHVLQAVAVESVAVDGNVATANVEARLTRWNTLPGGAVETDVQRSVILLRRERDEWKIGEWRMQEEDLVQRMLVLPKREERESLLRSAGDLRSARLVRILCREAVTMSNRDKPAGAMEIVAQAKEIAAELEDPSALSDVLGVESIFARRTDLPLGLAYAQTAVALAEESGDLDALARALMRLGRAQATVLAIEDAASSFERVVALAEFVEDASILALSASQLSKIHDDHARPREALRYAIVASEHGAATGDPASIISAELNLAGTYASRRDFEMAIPHMEIVLATAEKAGFSSTQAHALERLATFRLFNGEGEQFLELSSKALDLLGDSDDVETHANILLSRANYRISTKDYGGAEKELERAGRVILPFKQRTQMHRLVDHAMGRLRIAQGRYEEAIQYIEQLNPSDPWMLATALEGQGHKKEARQAWEEAIRGIEQYRTRLDLSQHRGLFLNVYSVPYIRLVENLIEAGEQRQALDVAERLKARELKDLLASTRGAPRINDRELKRLDEQIVELNRRLQAIQREHGDPTRVRTQLRRARSQLEEARTRADHESSSVQQASPAFDLEALPRDTTVVEFVVGEDQTTVFVIRRRSGAIELRTHVVAIAATDLRSLARRLTRSIEQRDANYRSHSRRLYDLLLRPVIGADPARTTLCVIPDADLWLVPFQALITPQGDHLIERGPLYYAPSLSTLLAPSRKSPAVRRPTLLAFADPKIDTDTAGEIYAVHRDAALGRLPDAEREVREIQRVYGTRASVHVGSLASESIVKRDAGNYDIVHFATHGILDVHAPMYSALLLAGSENEDGLLEAREIVGLPLDADLVVLSACDTARGRIQGGEGVVGLSWAILATGCPRTIATQWRVGSASAARLMIAFHKKLATQKTVTNVAHCLRDAQLGMLGSRLYAHPYYWAGFVLVGRDD